jgi:cyclin B
MITTFPSRSRFCLFAQAAKSDARTHTLSKYLTELSMPEFAMLRFSPSTIAAAAVYLARKMTGKSPTWVRELCLPIAL